MIYNTKKWYKSKTIQGGIITILMFILTISGIDIDKSLITEFVTTALALFGTGMTIYGRIKAQTDII